MKTGWLVVNQFLHTEKFNEHYRSFCREAEKAGLRLILKENGSLLNESGLAFLQKEEKLPDFVLFWDKDLSLALALEKMGLRLFNRAEAIRRCDDKGLTHLTLSGKLPMPRTICAPMTYPGVTYDDLSFVSRGVSALGLPMVIKECFGSFGSQVYLVHSLEEAEQLSLSLSGKPFLFQEFISFSHGRDVRLQVVGGKTVASMLRYNESGDFRANITNGGAMKAYAPSVAMQEMAVKACELLGLDFAGVDFLFGEEGPLLCEVNSNAHFKNLYDCTGVNTAEAIIAHIKSSI